MKTRASSATLGLKKQSMAPGAFAKARAHPSTP
jgi:hypothetical protein